MKKVLVTGAAGFIGSHLSELLTKQGFHVVAFDRYNSENFWGWLEKSPLRGEMEVILGDIRDYDSVNNAMKGCGVVFHLAALVGIPYSYISPLAYIQTNITGTYNVLESARNYKVSQVLITSTSETYGTAQTVPIREDHPLVGQSPYSASKISADQISLSYFRSFDLPIKIVRPFNTYGPRQSARAIIPAVITQILSDKKEIKLGNLSPTRDLTYVLDTCKAFLDIYEEGSLKGEVVNIGNSSEISIKDLVTLISSLIGREVKIISEEERIRPEKSEVDRLLCDNSKLIESTKWNPEFSLKEGLIETIKWFENKENFNLYKTGIYNI